MSQKTPENSLKSDQIYSVVCKNTFVSSFCTQLSGVYKKYCNELLFNFHTLYRHSRQCHYYNVNVQLCASICLVNIKLAKK